MDVAVCDAVGDAVRLELVVSEGVAVAVVDSDGVEEPVLVKVLVVLAV